MPTRVPTKTPNQAVAAGKFKRREQSRQPVIGNAVLGADSGLAKSAGQPTKAKAVAKNKTNKAVASSSAKTRVASTAKAEKRP